jgi:hypothetical protein
MRTEWMLRKDGATPGGKAGAAAEPGESLVMPAIIGLTSLTHRVSRNPTGGWRRPGQPERGGTAGATANVSERSFDQELAEKLPPG